MTATGFDSFIPSQYPLHHMPEFQPDLADTFEQCERCGTWIVHPPTHTCNPEQRRRTPTRAERITAAEHDSRDDDDDVLLVPSRKKGSGYAYHELTDEGDLVCGGPGTATRAEYITVTRKEAKQRRRAPCKRCQQFNEDSEEDRMEPHS